MSNSQGKSRPQETGVVIVTYNSADVIAACLAKLAPWQVPVVVVDNQSADDTVSIASAHPVRIIRNSGNRGFAAAVNQGIQALDTPFVLILNPDVQATLCPGDLLGTFETERVGAVAATLLGENRQPQHRFQFRRFPKPVTLIAESLGINRLWPSNPVNRRYRYQDIDWTKPGPVEQPAGAYLLVRRAAWQEIGGFDERFHPLWFEDVDFCQRLWQNGWQILRVPVIAGIHSGGHSIRPLDPGCRQLYWYRSLLQYSAKHFSSFWVRAIALSIMAGSMGRTMGELVRGGRVSVLRVWGPVTMLAMGTVISGRPLSSSPVPPSEGGRQKT